MAVRNRCERAVPEQQLAQARGPPALVDVGSSCEGEEEWKARASRVGASALCPAFKSSAGWLDFTRSAKRPLTMEHTLLSSTPLLRWACCHEALLGSSEVVVIGVLPTANVLYEMSHDQLRTIWEM